MLKQLILLLTITCATKAMAQGKAEWENYLEQIYGLEEYDETQMEEAYERLCELEAAPMNINTATQEQLSDIPGLSADIIDEIVKYRDKYGLFRTMEELAMLPGIDTPLRLYLTHFLYAGKPEQGKWYDKANLARILRSGNRELEATTTIPFYTRKGDSEGYLGSRYRYAIKLTGKHSEHIKYGFIGAQDAGEPFFCKGNNLGFDHYSFYLSVQGLGRIKAVTLGRYRLRMGMGLLMNSATSFGKQMMLSSMKRPNTVISGHSSRSAANYLQGAAATIDLSKQGSHNSWLLTAFSSYRYIDATLADNGTVKTIVKTGYHRTDSEMQRKHNTAESINGAHLTYDCGPWHAGATALYDWFNRHLEPPTTADYRRYDPRGNAFWNASVEYGYTGSRFSFSGETATGDSKGIATVNTMQLKLTSDWTLTALQRYYSKQYYALHANSFSDGSGVKNESGLYLGLRWRASRQFTMEAYSDYAYHPWKRYLVSASSYSLDNSLSGTYSGKQWTLSSRYVLRVKQRDNADKTALFNRFEHRGRLTAVRTLGLWSWKSQLDLNHVTSEQDGSLGWMLSQQATYSPRKALQLSATAAYFHTKDYDSRVSAYEKGIPGSFSLPLYYGEGIRLSAMCKAQLAPRLTAAGKIGFTKYFDRDVISSALRQIDGSCQTDLELLLKWKF